MITIRNLGCGMHNIRLTHNQFTISLACTEVVESMRIFEGEKDLTHLHPRCVPDMDEVFIDDFDEVLETIRLMDFGQFKQ